MKTYIIPCVESIDWSLAEAQALEECAWSPNKAPGAAVQALYLRGEALLFRVRSFAKPSRAEAVGPDSAVWEDSCLECFFSFDEKNYVNLEANANSALRASFGPERKGRAFLREMDIPMPQARAAVTEEGWELVFTVPVGCVSALWGVELKPGTAFTANFYSCGDKTPAPHFASWNPIDTPAPDFHRPEFFGSLSIAG